MNRLSCLVRDLEKEIREWKKKDSPTDECEHMANAVRQFCFDCPLKDGTECVLCYLNRWKEGIDE